MVLQPVRRTAEVYCYLRGGLLPHLFTLTPNPEPQRSKFHLGRLFSVTLLCPHGHQAINLNGALCCSDFPPPAYAGSDRASVPFYLYLLLIRVINSSRVRGSERKMPVNAEVVVAELCFSTPLICIHIWLASITTATPIGLRAS